jgi:lipopolysaccharide biosynthesis regulator YciM
MTDLPLLTWILVVAALVLGILAGHFGWGKRWHVPLSKLHPDYLTGLDYLVSEQPDRALDMFLKLMDANADTIETHFALGSLYRRRGEVERAIRIHQNLLAREQLAPEHREQALLALAQDYLRAGLLDRAEGLFQQVSEVPRLRASALDALRLVYERQHDWQQALGAYRQLARIKAAPRGIVAAHYLCELATLAIERGDAADARQLLREARAEAAPFPRAAVLRAQIAERGWRCACCGGRSPTRLNCCRTSCRIC